MKLIDKDALVAKIEELLSPIKYRIERDKNDPWDSDVKVLEFSKRLLSFLDTLEVKEVELDKEELPVSHNFTEEGLLTFKDGSRGIIKRMPSVSEIRQASEILHPLCVHGRAFFLYEFAEKIVEWCFNRKKEN